MQYPTGDDVIKAVETINETLLRLQLGFESANSDRKLPAARRANSLAASKRILRVRQYMREELLGVV